MVWCKKVSVGTRRNDPHLELQGMCMGRGVIETRQSLARTLQYQELQCYSFQRRTSASISGGGAAGAEGSSPSAGTANTAGTARPALRGSGRGPGAATAVTAEAGTLHSARRRRCSVLLSVQHHHSAMWSYMARKDCTTDRKGFKYCIAAETEHARSSTWGTCSRGPEYRSWRLFAHAMDFG